MPERSRAISTLFSNQVVVETGTPGAIEGQLFADELECVERAVEKRRDEFSAGRLLARRALARLDCPATAILPAEDRSPVWPAGIAGTITHTRSLCAVAIAKLSEVRCLGLDVEEYTPLKTELVERICTAPEIEWIQKQTSSIEERAQLAKLFFSAKEAFYKCQYPLTGRFLEFHDVQLTVNLEQQNFTAEVRDKVDELPSNLRLKTRFLHLDEFIVCAVEG